MPVDEGQRDLYLRRLKGALEQRREAVGRVRERLQIARLEDDAQALISAAENVVLNDAGLVDQDDVSVLAAERDRLMAEIDALQALAQAVRSL
jgi:hypothetical protein